MALFGEKGYNLTSIDDIAQRANFAVGGFYQHFSDCPSGLHVWGEACDVTPGLTGGRGGYSELVHVRELVDPGGRGHAVLVPAAVELTVVGGDKHAVGFPERVDGPASCQTR